MNDTNIIFPNATDITAYFAVWYDKDTPVPAQVLDGTPADADPLMMDNIISGNVEASVKDANAVIFKNIPLTSINDIQAIVLYHRAGDGNVPRAIKLIIELYNTNNDPNLTNALAKTNAIETGVRRYRYDFPSIGTYNLGFSSGDSITQIPLTDYDGTTTFATITEEAIILGQIDINGNAIISGTLSSNSLIVGGIDIVALIDQRIAAAAV